MIRCSPTTTAVLALGFALGCGGKAPVALSPTADPSSSRWNATLGTPGEMQGVVQARGTASVAAARLLSQSTVDITMSNMTPGGTHPWKLQRGQCGSGGAELLRVTDGRMLKVGSDGQAHVDATVDLNFPSSGDYFVAVMASSANADQVIACGNLAPPSTPPVRSSGY